MIQETDLVRARYERRKYLIKPNQYSPLNPSVWQSIHERQRVTLKIFAKVGFTNLSKIKLLEVGCGTGGNLLEFLRFGFQPENLKGIELLEDRAAQANRVLPFGIVDCADANTATVIPASQDVVFQSVVFSSFLNDGFQADLANRMWEWVKPGGAVLWYDFIYNNPNNPDVRGVSLKRVNELFPKGKIITRRVTLAPPVARRICRIHSSLYSLFNMFPWLRTHVLCWIAKP